MVERIGDEWVVDIRQGSEPARIETAYEGSDWFADDNANTHEANINRIAELGVTVGCSTEPARFCPNRPVSRAEMAAFMLRAVGESQPTPSQSHAFEDVPDGVWYTKFVHALAERRVDLGQNGRWRPTEPLTRLEMAHWVTRMFESIPPSADPMLLCSPNRVLAGGGVLSLWGCYGVSGNGGAGSVGGGFWRSR